MGADRPEDHGKPATSVAEKRAGKPASGRDVGDALRSVYQKTIDEAVPDEFLDLLGKLD